MLQGLDADQDLSRWAGAMKVAGLSFVCRYMKNLSLREAQTLGEAGLALVVIWETTAGRALLGRQAGLQDGQRAVAWMEMMKAPPEAAIYLTVDSDVGEEGLPAVEEYFAAADEFIWGKYKIGGYADGTVLSRRRLNGATVSSGQVTIGSLNTSTTRLGIGAGNAAGVSLPFAGVIRHVIIRPYDPTTWTKMEGYLAWDGWSTAASNPLPASHPYKYAAP